MKYNNGMEYNGEWKNNNIEGQGKFEYNNKAIFEGEWKEGILINGIIKSEYFDNQKIVVENSKFQKEKIKVLFICNNSVDISKIIENDNKENYEENEEEIYFSFDKNEKLINSSEEKLEIIKVNEDDISENIIEEAKIIILIYDIFDKNSFQNLQLSYEKLKSKNNLKK